ncbi:WecB/TagA/CpsF family glycosyltransferase [Paenibacillus methanolicus]|uniref:N-acetylglucosaminyldiphosphoundecaprenol N-acetyl-beta-D-mannosaminyltransferase n=1 Tax=Paenibacillus methanolicus TaxID=582686 RepID=A0A5S5BS60_9BACL|nr:WecB/TagA/CpsF family glycosyltransferase [Paenibacillus methanolicus]TYP69126.1 N-acetylglucosaminyldiphosphoundecaprenol N-acetyl-beta-D-mannosaminyltransferase [Paenibacillus methanolicus]
MGNVKCHVTNASESLELMSQKEKLSIFYLNAHCYNVSQKDEEYRACLNEADMVLNDGVGVDIGSQLFGFRFHENLNGTDHNVRILEMAAQAGLRVYLLGAAPGIAITAAEKLCAKIPGLQIVGVQDGFFEDSQAVVREINDLKTDVLIVGMGVPRQEKWISQHFAQLDVKIAVGVGAFIDFMAGKFPRAPKMMINLKLEWMFRFLQEPKRLWKRYLLGNVMFFYYIIKNRLTHGESK